MIEDSIAKRFWSYVDITDTCWNWTGYKKRGYGSIRVNGKFIGAHRLSFYIHNGVFPNVCRHTCDNPKCVNPAHLLDGTHKDNHQDCVLRGRARGGSRYKNAQSCKQGHPYTPSNVYQWEMSNGKFARLCRTCNRERMREYRIRKRLVQSSGNEKTFGLSG